MDLNMYVIFFIFVCQPITCVDSALSLTFRENFIKFLDILNNIVRVCVIGDIVKICPVDRLK